ncbi:multidrug effflux MFS transporter [Nocardioides sp. SYSU DS0651]|uniref:multidrug effflux MFS transporter n=1 Tax=Nocardioides sp. SYSU DS0651 TaxID=3415955 RepID=UPI003F4C7803
MHDERRSLRLTVAIPVVLASLSMLGPFSIDTPFPAFPAMGRDFGVDARALQLVVTVYLAAFAAMSMFHGPLSDAVGRRPVIVGSIVVYVAASVGCALAPSLGVLLVFRAIQGLSAGGATIVSRTVVRDLFEGPTAQRLMSRVAVIFGIAPAIGPVIGGLLLQAGPWPLVFVFQGALGVALILTVLVVLPETHPPAARVPLRVREVGRGIGDVGRRAAFQRLAWATALLFGAQFLYIGGAAIFVVDLLGMGELDFWKFFVPMIGSMMLGSWLCGRAAGRITARRLVTLGCGIATGGGLLGVGLASSPLEATMPWAIVGPSLLALGNGMTYPTTQLLMLDLFPDRRGAVVSFASFIALMFNALTTSLLTPFVATSTFGLALAALALVLAGQALWTWHCAVEDRDCAAPAHPGDLEPTELL